MKIEKVITNKSFYEFLTWFPTREVSHAIHSHGSTIEELRTQHGELIVITINESFALANTVIRISSHVYSVKADEKFIVKIIATGRVMKNLLYYIEGCAIEYAKYLGMPCEEVECTIYSDREFAPPA